MHHDFSTLTVQVVVDVLSMIDVLDHTPYPADMLRKAAQVLRPGGLLVVGMPDLMSSSFRMMDAAKTNPYWTDIGRHHNFSRERIVALLQASEFEVVDFALPGRQPAQMEIIAVRK
jgi:trans-aconitate methyltransferase